MCLSLKYSHMQRYRLFSFKKIILMGAVILFSVSSIYWHSTFLSLIGVSSDIKNQPDYLPAVLNSTGTRALYENSSPVDVKSLLAQILDNSEFFKSIETDVTITPYVKNSHTIEILLTNNSIPLNAAEVELFFDPTQLIVTDLKIAESICQQHFVITKYVNNENGKIFYQCGTVNPFSGSSTVLATLSVMPVKTGTSTLYFGKNTHLLAHDGYGTNVLTHINESVYMNPSPNLSIYSVIQNE